MEDIWDQEGGLSQDFANSFGSWVSQQSGALDEVTDTEIVCTFDQVGDGMGLTVGLHESTGRKQLTVRSLRDEIVLRMITKYNLGERRLVFQSGRGSRRFVLDIPNEEWTIKRRQI